MPPSRSALEEASLLVSVMKENAELKSALETKSRDIQAAEHALMLLINENQDLGRQAEAANKVLVEGQTRVKHLTEKLRDAGGEIEKLLAEREDKAKRIHHLEGKVDRLSEEKRGRRGSEDGHHRERERSSRRDPADRHHTSKRDESASPPRHSRFSAPRPPSPHRAHSRDASRDRSDLSSWKTSAQSYSHSREESGKHSQSNSAGNVNARIKTEAVPPPSEPLSHRKMSSTLWSFASNNKPITERTILNQYMSSLPLPKIVARSGAFQENQAVQTADASQKIFKDFPSKRTALHLPGRTLWCQGTQLHAIAYAPTHEYDNGKWRPHLHLSSLAATSAEVDLFANHREMVHYAGIYRVLSFRRVDGYVAGGHIPIVEISHPAIYRAMNLSPNVNSRENDLKLRQNPAFADGQPKTECFGLQYLGYDEDVQRQLRARFTGTGTSDTKLKDRIGGLGKRKWDKDGPGEDGGDARWKKKNATGEKLYQHKVWVRRAHAED